MLKNCETKIRLNIYAFFISTIVMPHFIIQMILIYMYDFPFGRTDLISFIPVIFGYTLLTFMFGGYISNKINKYIDIYSGQNERIGPEYIKSIFNHKLFER